jgi:hypothetical protein
MEAEIPDISDSSSLAMRESGNTRHRERVKIRGVQMMDMVKRRQTRHHWQKMKWWRHHDALEAPFDSRQDDIHAETRKLMAV